VRSLAGKGGDTDDVARWKKREGRECVTDRKKKKNHESKERDNFLPKIKNQSAPSSLEEKKERRASLRTE